jgi:hypothetical protein
MGVPDRRGDPDQRPDGRYGEPLQEQQPADLPRGVAGRQEQADLLCPAFQGEPEEEPDEEEGGRDQQPAEHQQEHGEVGPADAGRQHSLPGRLELEPGRGRV